MKNILIILIFALAFVKVQGQAANQVFTSDTTHGDENVYFTGTKQSHIYQGIAGFTFTTDHDTADFILQGCYKAGAWYNIDTINAENTTPVNRELYQTPPKYLYYRLWADGSLGDTCIITNVRYFLKY